MPVVIYFIDKVISILAGLFLIVLTCSLHYFSGNVLSLSHYMKKLAAILFLTIFTLMMLPLKQIGKMLWDNQMTEEVHEHGPCHKKMTNNNDHDKFWYHHLFAPIRVEDSKIVCYKHASRPVALIKCHHLDVPLQPPNFC